MHSLPVMNAIEFQLAVKKAAERCGYTYQFAGPNLAEVTTTTLRNSGQHEVANEFIHEVVNRTGCYLKFEHRIAGEATPSGVLHAWKYCFCNL